MAKKKNHRADIKNHNNTLDKNNANRLNENNRRYQGGESADK